MVHVQQNKEQGAKLPSGLRLGADLAPGLGFTGVGYHADKHQYGVEILEVRQNTLAARAGLRAGDVIESLNGRSMAGIVNLEKALSAAGPHTKLHFQILRGAEHIKVEITGYAPRGSLGVSTTDCPSISFKHGNQTLHTGPAVNGFRGQGFNPAEKAGIKVGDYICAMKKSGEAGLTQISDGTDLSAKLRDSRAGEVITFLIGRDTKEGFITKAIKVHMGRSLNKGGDKNAANTQRTNF